MNDHDGRDTRQSKQREQIRWIVLDALNHGRPYPVAEPLILSALRGEAIQCTVLDLRLELGYLWERGLVKMGHLEGAPQCALLTDAGIEIVEYNAAAPGIARPHRMGCGFEQSPPLH